MKKLTRIDLIEGRKKCIENAEELITEADLLFQHGHYARTLFLSQLAGEEIGKYLSLSSAIIEITVGTLDLNKFWRTFRNHKDKTSIITYLEAIALSKSVDEEKEEIKKIKDNVKTLEEGKLLGMYVDFTEEKFYKPSDLISDEMALAALQIAKGRYSLIKTLDSDMDEEKLKNVNDDDIIEAYKEFKKNYS